MMISAIPVESHYISEITLLTEVGRALVVRYTHFGHEQLHIGPALLRPRLHSGSRVRRVLQVW